MNRNIFAWIQKKNNAIQFLQKTAFDEQQPDPRLTMSLIKHRLSFVPVLHGWLRTLSNRPKLIAFFFNMCVSNQQFACTPLWSTLVRWWLIHIQGHISFGKHIFHHQEEGVTFPYMLTYIQRLVYKRFCGSWFYGQRKKVCYGWLMKKKKKN